MEQSNLNEAIEATNTAINALHVNVNNELEEEDKLLYPERSNSKVPPVSEKQQAVVATNGKQKVESYVEETQPGERAPRPLCLGPPKFNGRGARGSRNRASKNSERSIATPLLSTSTEQKANEPVSQSVASQLSSKTTEVRGKGNKPNNQKRNKTQAEAASRSFPKSNDQVNKPQKSKRQRSSNNTPENKNKRQRTVGDVLSDDLKVYVVDIAGGLNKDNVGEVEKALVAELDDYIETTNDRFHIPTFHSMTFMDPYLRIIGTDVLSAQWIKATITKIPPPWEGAKIQEVEFKREPIVRLPTIRFFIPHGMRQQTFQEISKKLGLQSQLETSDWKAWNAEEKEGGVFYHVSVQDHIVQAIRDRDCRLFYLFGKIKIIVPKLRETTQGNGIGENNTNSKMET